MRCALLFVGALLSLAGCGGVTNASGVEGPLAVGASCPSLSATDSRGEVITLPGPPVTLVFFYPKDGTPGCTTEACAFRDAWGRFDGAGLRVVGVSADSDAEHRAFAEEHELPFPLISDPEFVWANAFGVGRVLGMIRRVSFLIGADGKVARVYPDVDPGVHAEEVLGDARRLGLLVEPSRH